MTGAEPACEIPASLPAISLRQPWASLIAMGSLRRCQVAAPISHRGLVAIHARGRDSYANASAGWNDLVASASRGRTPLAFPLPQSAVIALGLIVDCVESTVGWELRFNDVRRAAALLPSSGANGIWTWEPPAHARRREFWNAVTASGPYA